MSRITEALKRAQEANREVLGGLPAATAPEPEEAPSQGEVFSDAWGLDNRPAAADVPPADAAPPDPARTGEGFESLAPPPSGLALFQDFNPVVAEKIVATPSVRPAFAEQYRRLAGTLHQAQVERGVKRVMITSALPGEGKTLTATNLALTFSESFQRTVLLVDADLRRPSLHDIFQVPNVSGLGDGLRAGEDEKLSLVQITPRLTLLTAGRPDPDPLGGLTSDRMRRVLEEAARRFDWVVIDTPPVGLLPDANLLAGMVDSTLLVVQAGKTPYTLVQRAAAAIGRERILGVVLNRAEESIGTSHGYYSYYDAYRKKKQDVN